jgi:predicted nuclease of predicted toxin-antitoxin system
LKLKIDENLPADCAILLRNAGFEADTVADEHLAGADDAVIASRSRSADRVLDFSNVRAYPPAQHGGIIVLRPKRQDKRTVLALIERTVLALANRTPAGNSGSWNRIEFGSALDSETTRDAPAIGVWGGAR